MEERMTMRYLTICMIFFLLIGCIEKVERTELFNFSDSQSSIMLKLPLPRDWIQYKTLNFLDNYMIYNNMLGDRDSSSWINVKMYSNKDFLNADMNSLLNWQIELDIKGNESVKIEKYIDNVSQRKSMGVLQITLPGIRETWYERMIIINDQSEVVVLSLMDKKSERRLERTFQCLKSDLKVEFKK